MADIPLPLLAVVSSLLVVLLVCVALVAVRRRRRATGVEVPAGEPDQGHEVGAAEHTDAPARRMLDVQQVPLRRVHGRHSAEPAAHSGAMLLLLVPIVAKRRRPPLDAHPAIGSSSTAPDDDSVLVPAVADLADPVGHRPAVAATGEDVQVYRRRVNATIQAISRRSSPGDPPELLEARMLAAVERLDAPAGFVRPRLSRSGPAEWPSLPGPTAVPPEELAAAPRTDPVEQPPTEAAHPVPVSVLDTEDLSPNAQDWETCDAAEVVLPVPPMATPAEVRRRGLRRRRGTVR